MNTPVMLKGHVYVGPDGTKLPAVTRILRIAGYLPDYTGIDPRYAERGKKVHSLTELYDAEEIPFDDLLLFYPEYAGYITGWKKFRDTTGAVPVPEWMERMVYHPSMLFAGRLDRVMMFGEKAYVIDIKTGRGGNRTTLGTRCQMSAYWELARVNGAPPIVGAIAVRLPGDDTFKPDPISQDFPKYLSGFMAALTCYRMRMEHGMMPVSLGPMDTDPDEDPEDWI